MTQIDYHHVERSLNSTPEIDESGRPAAKRIGQLSLETQHLIAALRKVPEGQNDYLDDESDLVSYAALTAIAGRDVAPGGAGYPYLCAARRHLKREHMILFKTERRRDGLAFDGGLRRMPNSDRLAVAEQGRNRVKRASAAVLDVLATIDYERLTADDRDRFNTEASLAGATRFLMTPKTVKAVAQHVRIAQQAEVAGKLLALFGTPPAIKLRG